MPRHPFNSLNARPRLRISAAGTHGRQPQKRKNVARRLIARFWLHCAGSGRPNAGLLVPPSSGRHGRRPRARAATTTPSSSTIPASPLRSMRAWSRPTPRATSRSSGPAAPQSDPTNTKPRRKAGLRHVQIRRCRSLSDAAGYALAGALRAFFTGDLIAAAVVLAAAARADRFAFFCRGRCGRRRLAPEPN